MNKRNYMIQLSGDQIAIYFKDRFEVSHFSPTTIHYVEEELSDEEILILKLKFDSIVITEVEEFLSKTWYTI